MQKTTEQNGSEPEKRFERNNELSDFVQLLWRLDMNRPRPYWDFAVDCNARRLKSNDMPPATLFAFVNEDLLMKITTFRRLLRLLIIYDSLSADVNSEATSSKIPLEEYQMRFLRACVETPLMRKLYEYLKKRKYITDKDLEAFTSRLYNIWFTPSEISVSGRKVTATLFERTFVGRTKNKEQLPFNYWLQYYFLELEGILTFNKVEDDGCKDHIRHRVLTINYQWSDPNLAYIKPKGSMLIGTTPEFEIALYTLCVLIKVPEVDLRLAHCNVRMRCKHDISGSRISEIYPVFVPTQYTEPITDISAAHIMDGTRQRRHSSRPRTVYYPSFTNRQRYVHRTIKNNEPPINCY